jgi:hypothetical protein
MHTPPHHLADTAPLADKWRGLLAAAKAAGSTVGNASTGSMDQVASSGPLGSPYGATRQNALLLGGFGPVGDAGASYLPAGVQPPPPPPAPLCGPVCTWQPPTALAWAGAVAQPPFTGCL